MPVSNSPKTNPTRRRVRVSTPLTPMPTAPAKSDRPSETATSSKASTGQRYIPPGHARNETAVRCGSAASQPMPNQPATVRPRTAVAMTAVTATHTVATTRKTGPFAAVPSRLRRLARTST